MTQKITINIIMGFLGVGKTTSILTVLKQKPANEKWAVLVNEFGEVGIDGAILSAESGMIISEVPGGCLCCVSGIPFQAALANLIAQQKPDRILIEPTGLGHPKNLIRTLTTKDYLQRIELKASICLVDPRQLKDPRYQQHETFNDQCYLADVLVANKTDVCDEQDKDNFYQFASAIRPVKTALGWVENGQIDLEWLDLERDESRQCKGYQHHHHHNNSHSHLSKSEDEGIKLVSLAPGQNYQTFENQGMGYFSLGWLLAGDQIFDHSALTQWLMLLEVERVKGLLITDKGARVINITNKVFTEMPTRTLQQSRIEIIHNQALNKAKIEQNLLACLLK
ncbi:MAG: GTP-binding protein [Oleispira antarctica]|nr:GTP-binding protein [Oleispira antarctica]MBQ0792579.1 GTP-binding protein [Oleispira antarctica]